MTNQQIIMALTTDCLMNNFEIIKALYPSKVYKVLELSKKIEPEDRSHVLNVSPAEVMGPALDILIESLEQVLTDKMK